MSAKIRAAVFNPKVLSLIFLSLGSLFILISRWLTRSQYFYHWDGVQFGLALEHFDLSQHQPHPPGYILYIALGRVINFFVNDPHTALILLSILFSISTFLVLFFFARSIFGKLNAYLSAFFLLFVPIFWFHGSVALIYAAEAFWVVLLAYLAWLTIKNKSFSSFLWFSLVLGISGGFRETLLIFLAPLWLYLAWRMGFKKALGGFFALTLPILTWFIPLLSLSGGIGGYFDLLRKILSNMVSMPGQRSVLASGAAASWHNLLVMLSIFWQSFNFGLLVFLMVAFVPFFAEIRKTINYQSDYRKWWLFGLLFLPAVLFYLFIFFSNPGYMLFAVVVLVPLFVEGLVSLARIPASLQPASVWRKAAVIGGILSLVLLYNFLLWTRPSPLAWRPLLFSFKQIKQTDKLLSLQVNGVKNFFNSKNALILVDGEFIHSGFRHYMYYLPNYKVYSPVPLALRASKTDSAKVWVGCGRHSWIADKMVIEKGIRRVIFVRSQWNMLANHNGILLPGGLFMVYFDLSNESDIEELGRFKAVQFIKGSG